jgi:alkylation response protein AidB-like acyl-CoA dehydrogenase
MAQFAIEVEALRYSDYRQLTRRLRGNPPGPEGSMGKLFGSELNLRMVNFALELLGPYSQLSLDSPCSVDGGRWARRALGARALTIAGGTSEIMRGIIGDRVLGLPKG